MRKTLFLSIILSTLSSCEKMLPDDTPKCNDEHVKNEAVRVFTEKVKPLLIDSYIEEEIKENDLQEYAYDNGLDATDVINEEKERLKEKFAAKAEVNLKSTKIKNIRTEKVEKDIHKCNCVADIENLNLKPIKLFYTAQKTEDNPDGVYVETSFELKK